MSHKGSRSRVTNLTAYQACPVWHNKATRIIDIIKEYPSETLTYEKGFELESFDLPLETHFKSVDEIPVDGEKAELALIHAHLNESNSEERPRIFKITNHQGQTCKIAVWIG